MQQFFLNIIKIFFSKTNVYYDMNLILFKVWILTIKIHNMNLHRTRLGFFRSEIWEKAFSQHCIKWVCVCKSKIFSEKLDFSLFESNSLTSHSTIFPITSDGLGNIPKYEV